MTRTIWLSIMASVFFTSTAHAITREQREHEQSLTELATQRCNSELIEGNDYKVKAIGDGKVEVSFFGKKGAELNGTFIYSKSAWEGRQRVLLEHQASESKNRRKCIQEEVRSLEKTYKPPIKINESRHRPGDNHGPSLVRGTYSYGGPDLTTNMRRQSYMTIYDEKGCGGRGKGRDKAQCWRKGDGSIVALNQACDTRITYKSEPVFSDCTNIFLPGTDIHVECCFKN